MTTVRSIRRYVRDCRALEREVWAQRQPPQAAQRLAAISANFFNLLPSLPVADHAAAAKQISITERLSLIDQRHGDALVPRIRAQGEKLDLSGGPAVFCSYHLGPYRLAVPFLIGQGVKLTVVTDKNVVKQQGAVFEGLISQYQKDLNAPPDQCQWRDTSEASLLLSLARDMRRGRSIFFYIDGNTSVNAEAGAREKNTVPIDFLGARLFARAGVATLAHMTKSKIVPIVMRRDLDEADPISAEIGRPYEWTGNDRTAYVEGACSWMWQVLESEIVREPFAWEPWRYVHRFLDIEGYEQAERNLPPADLASTDSTDLVFDEERFAMAGVEDENYLFDRRLYRFYPISAAMRDVLEAVKSGGVASLDIGRNLVAKLVSMRVLVVDRS